MTQKIILTCLIISFLSSCFSGCFTPDDIYLSEEQKRERIELEYQKEYERLQKSVDNSCEENFPKMVNRAVDSLVNVYLDSTKYDY